MNRLKILFENKYCRITERKGYWYRFCKVLGNTLPCDSYFDSEGNLHHNKEMI